MLQEYPANILVASWDENKKSSGFSYWPWLFLPGTLLEPSLKVKRVFLRAF